MGLHPILSLALLINISIFRTFCFKALKNRCETLDISYKNNLADFCINSKKNLAIFNKSRNFALAMVLIFPFREKD
jgi:hypothetical protein